VPLLGLNCADNHVNSLEPLRGMRLQSLTCSRNRIASLEPLRGMPLARLYISGNPLATLEPFVDSPPQDFDFDCPSLPDAELERVRDIWNLRPEHRRHARNAGVLLALRHHDLAALSQLASVFQGHRYLFVPRPLAWADASAVCRDVGGHLATIHSREENEFVSQLAAGIEFGALIGLRRQNGRMTWETGEPVAFTNLREELGSTRGDGPFVVAPGGAWRRAANPGDLSYFILEWDGDPPAAGKQP
jgi:hypothetical protein